MKISLFGKNLREGGQRPFLIHHHGTVTYADMQLLVSGACAFLRNMGLAAGARIIVLLEDEAQASAAFIAALLEGHVPVMLPFGIGTPRLNAIARVIEPALIIDNADVFAGSADLPPELPDLGTDALGYLLFTSGTTAAPSGVEITRGNLCSHLDTLIRLYGFDHTTRIFNPTPIAHTDGLIFGPLLAVATGGTMIRPGAMRLSELDDWLGMAWRHGATHMMTNPTVLSLIDRACDRTDYFTFAGFRGILCSGSNLRPELWHHFEARFHTEIWNLYGLTETVTSALYAGRHPDMGPVGTLGKPIDCEARIAEPRSPALASRSRNVGELQLRGAHIFRGYWRNRERTDATFAPGGWMRTGDLVRRNEDGSYLFLGRVKTAINSGGTLIRGEEIDECLLRHPAVAEAVTVGLPDEEFEEIAVSAVVLGRTADEAELMHHCRSELEALKVPKRILLVPAIPRGDAGKPNLQSVKELLNGMLRPSPASLQAAPDDVERQLLNLAGMVFGVDPQCLSPASSPDTVEGWDSFRHVSLVLQAEALFGIRVPGELLGKIGTLGELIEVIRNLKSENGKGHQALREAVRSETTKTIAILGSCVSEDWYHFQDVRHRLDVVVPMRYQVSSLISIMAEPVDMTIEMGDRLKEIEKTSLQVDFDKSFLASMVKLKPDVLIVELLPDCREGHYGGVIAVDGSWISSTYILKRTPMAAKFSVARHLDVQNDPDEYFALFRQSARKLQQFLTRELPNCQVILNQARLAEYFIDEEGAVQSYSPWEQSMYFRANLRLDPLEKIFAEEVRCDLLRIDDVPIFADVRHIPGRSVDHYVKYFYTRFAEKMALLMNMPFSTSPVREPRSLANGGDANNLAFRELGGRSVRASFGAT